MKKSLVWLMLSVVALLGTNIVSSQDLSNKGKDFWITFPPHVDANLAVLGIYITSDRAATGKVDFNGYSLSFSIAANGVKTFFIGPNGDAPNNTVYLGLQEGIQTNAAIHVTSNQPVVVYAHIIRQARSGASLIIPTNVWGKEYLVPSYRSAGSSGTNSGFPSITVVAKEPNTVVEINPKATSRDGSKPAGVPYTITLSQPGDVYQVQFAKDQDISGSFVRSISTGTGGCKPIAVFSSTTWSAFDCTGASGGDNLYQQLFPTRAFGKSFLTAPFVKKVYDIIRVFVLDPTTVVKKTESGVTTTLGGLVGNSYYEYTTNRPTQIDADKPVSVVQYMTSQTCGNSTNSDPEMVILNPVEQTINNITLFSAHRSWVPVNQSNVNECYLNIIIKSNAASSFRINGALPLGVFTPIPGTVFSYLQADVTALSQTNPIQTLTADSSFIAIAYGYGNVESYGYNAGTNVKDLFQFISIKNEFATVNFPATCINAPFKFSITFPYQPTKIDWKFYNKFPDVTDNNPVADSSYVVEGRTIYRYSLPGSYTYNAIGTYKVTVVANNPTSDGCSGEQQIDYDVEVFQKPVANFTWQHTGCTTDSVKFIDNSNGLGRTINSFKWDFGNGTVDSVKNPVRKFNAAGNYVVKESIITDIGCLADTTKTIQITEPPAAKFGVSALTCVGSNIQFTDSSTVAAGGTITKWYWDFGNGRKDTMSANTPRTVVYPATGTFIVSLIVETQSGCRSVAFSRTITIHPFPVADFILPGGICLPNGSASFVNSSTISNGTQSQLVYLWNFGDGQTSTIKDPVHNYSGAGPFNVNLRVTSNAGCIKDTTKVLSTVYQQPKASFTVPAELCFRDSTKLSDQSTAVNQVVTKYFWNFGDNTTDTVANPSKRYAASGSYTIIHFVRSDKGCYSDTVTKVHVVNTLPTAAFNTSSILCEGQQMQFSDASVANAGTLNNWFWDLGDGTTLTPTNASPFVHTYTNAGNKTVKLAVQSTKGCKSDTLTKAIFINVRPKVNFDLPEVCLTDAFALFNNTTTISDGTLASMNYLWNFGDPNATGANPNTSGSKNPQHKYTATGNYPVFLKTTSSKGCVDSITQTLTVNGDKPKADFIVTNTGTICSTVPVNIQNKSTVNFGNVTKVEVYWEWPSITIKTVDDQPSFDKQYQHYYKPFSAPASKVYQIRFQAFSGGVCVNDVIKTITVQANPNVLFTQIPGICLDATARQITQAVDQAGLPGNGAFSGTGVSSTGLFNPANAGVGTHNITYIYTSSQGCGDTAVQPITVWPRPTANFNTDAPTCVTQSVTFRDASIANFGNLKQWNWVFGDGNSTTRTDNLPVTHTYTKTGSVNVQMTVMSDSGCVSTTISKAVNINPLPVVDFSLPVVCMPVGKADFTDRSTIPDGSQGQFTYFWTFGVGSGSSVQKNPTFFYPAVGSYNVKLVVTSKDGCKDSATKVLSDVNPQPLANFSFNPASVCLGDAYTFTAQNNPLSQTISGLFWSLGDGTSNSAATVTHTYKQAGTFNVSHYYQTTKGCYSDTVVKQVVVHPYPIVNAGPDQVVLEGGQATIKATATGSSSYQYQWSPGTYLNSINVLQPITKPTQDITYTLTVTGAGGCSASDDVFIKVLFAPEIPNAFSPNNDGINDTWNIQYLSSYPGATVQVFDRYGKLVYNSVGYNSPWDGKFNGREIPAGVYYYVIDPKNGRKVMQGSVTVVR
jgi:gliding motility-associated-like protein